ncbi:hypothetical protein AGDE_14582 [Angomonas deanei]|uniref:Uncharacterized protein n=1 Tax=Angomonas deanei TaxID=59799 RepID=A0A7G2C4L6_9TRYP|nr:hypothetical protein AGDE_14582 [Angomonas deanei]CAD2212832.1 hypothetical protein, conserved [Angomonas deanei]|eukprot:EPY20601.1 hypothetical protein AGDE_14582 [Angomonas deanei]
MLKQSGELKKPHDKLEGKRAIQDGMNNSYDGKKNELEEALKDIATLRKEHSDYERETTATIEKMREDLVTVG